MNEPNPEVDPLRGEGEGYLYSIAVYASDMAVTDEPLGYVALNPLQPQLRAVLDKDAKWETQDAQTVTYACNQLQRQADEMVARQKYVIMVRTYTIVYSDRKPVDIDDLQSYLHNRKVFR